MKTTYTFSALTADTPFIPKTRHGVYGMAAENNTPIRYVSRNIP